MRLFQQHAPHIPIPKVYRAVYNPNKKDAVYGELIMSLALGKSLMIVWANFDDTTKGRICSDIWDLGTQIRKISRPEHLMIHGDVYCTVDGSTSRDAILGDNNDVAPCFLDDQTLRDRIYTRYVAHNGLSYHDSACLPDRLPRSEHGCLYARGYQPAEHYGRRRRRANC